MNAKKKVGSYKDAHGKIEYGMTNDYMFHVVLQKNEKVLRGLICSVLHLKPETLQSVQITNPIEPGDNIDDKTFILDIHVILNNNTHLNLEMQVTNEHNWEERSLSYLCRTFDQLYSGDDYITAKPAIHIGFLNFSPFPDYPEFYAHFKLMNEKTHMVYSDKFLLNVVDLTQIELATEEDKEYQIDYWAKLFVAKTWEEMIMIAEKNPALSEAAQTIYETNLEDMEKLKCRARHDYYKMKHIAEAHLKEVTDERDALAMEVTVLNNEVELLKARIAELEAQNN